MDRSYLGKDHRAGTPSGPKRAVESPNPDSFQSPFALITIASLLRFPCTTFALSWQKRRPSAIWPRPFWISTSSSSSESSALKCRDLEPGEAAFEEAAIAWRSEAEMGSVAKVMLDLAACQQGRRTSGRTSSPPSAQRSGGWTDGGGARARTSGGQQRGAARTAYLLPQHLNSTLTGRGTSPARSARAQTRLVGGPNRDLRPVRAMTSASDRPDAYSQRGGGVDDVAPLNRRLRQRGRRRRRLLCRRARSREEGRGEARSCTRGGHGQNQGDPLFSSNIVAPR